MSDDLVPETSAECNRELLGPNTDVPSSDGGTGALTATPAQAAYGRLEDILPDAGVYCAAVIPFRGPVANKFRGTKAALVGLLTGFNNPSACVFHACSSYVEYGKNGKGRTRDKVQAVRSFWIDVDTAENLSVEEQAKKDLTKLFPTKKDAHEFLLAQLQLHGVPPPTHIVETSAGLHVYWAMDADMAPDEWQPVADKLKAYVVAGLGKIGADLTRVADATSVLRWPGTVHQKPGRQPFTCRMLRGEPQIDRGAFEASLDKAMATIGAPAPGARKPTSVVAMPNTFDDMLDTFLIKRFKQQNPNATDADVEAYRAEQLRRQAANHARRNGQPVKITIGGGVGEEAYANRPTEYRDDLKIAATIPYLKGTDFDPSTRHGCVKVAMALGNEVRTYGMPEGVARRVYHEIAASVPGYGNGDWSIKKNDELFDSMLATVLRGGHTGAPLTLASIIHAAKNNGMKPATAQPSTPAAAQHATAQHATAQPATANNALVIVTNTIDLEEIEWPVTNPETGKPSKHPENTEKLLKVLGVTVFKDTFADLHCIEGWHEHHELNDEAMRSLHQTALRLGLNIAKDAFTETVLDLALRDKRHPVLNYLRYRVWDGMPRIGKWLHTYGRAPDTPYVNTISELVLVAAVRRVLQPGVKFDAMLVLEGPQGAGKSSAIRVLFGNDWFTDALTLGADPRITIEQTRGKLGVEISELGGLERRDVELVKAQLSRQSDRAREAYARFTSEVPRQFVMIGTTNPEVGSGYLRDATGNRRFLPVPVKTFDLEALARDRDQLWAEAVTRERTYGKLELPSALWTYAAKVQESRRQRDPLEQAVADIIAGKKGFIPTEEVYTLIGLGLAAGGASRRTDRHSKTIARVMQRGGWTPARRRPLGGGVQRRGYQNDVSGDFYKVDVSGDLTPLKAATGPTHATATAAGSAKGPSP